MGVFFTNGVFFAAALLALGPRLASADAGQSRTPPSSEAQTSHLQFNRTSDAILTRGEFQQADAFGSAAEQAAYLGAYQMSYGPYGGQNPEREKLLKETAVAIEDCVNNRSCGDEKQALILKALVQYNAGQDIKRMMLTNSTNQQKMKSLEGSTPEQEEEYNKLWEAARSTSRSFEFVPHDKAKVVEDRTKYVKKGAKGDGALTNGFAKETYFSIDPKDVRTEIIVDSKEKAQQEILGQEFVKEYKAFFNNYTKGNPGHYYKYVPAQPGSAVSVLAQDENGNFMADQDRYTAAMKEQDSAGVRRAVDNFNKDLDGFAASRGQQNDQKIAPGRLGLGKTQDFVYDPKSTIDPKEIEKIDQETYAADVDPEAQKRDRNAKKIALDINNRFRETYEIQRKQELQKAGRSIASAKAADAVSRKVTITLNATEFSNFLDEIWPNAEQRKKILNPAP